MDAFLIDAQQILDTALAGDASSTEWAVVVDRQGGIRLLDPAGWNLAALAVEFGARSVFCVRRGAGSVRVEGRSDGRSCILEQETTPRHGVRYNPAFGWLNPRSLPPIALRCDATHSEKDLIPEAGRAVAGLLR